MIEVGQLKACLKYLENIEELKKAELGEHAAASLSCVTPVVERWLRETPVSSAGERLVEWLKKNDESAGFAQFRFRNQEHTDSCGDFTAQLRLSDLAGMDECIAEWNKDVAQGIHAYRESLRRLDQAFKNAEFRICTAETMDQVRSVLAKMEAYDVNLR